MNQFIFEMAIAEGFDSSKCRKEGSRIYIYIHQYTINNTKNNRTSSDVMDEIIQNRLRKEG